MKSSIEKLYDLALTKDDEGMTVFEEQKLRDRFKHSRRLFAHNKDIFRENEPRFSTCPRYNPCPICDKCLNKASHLYVACQNCTIPICVHKYEDRVRMIRRENFALQVPEEVQEQFRQLKSKVMRE